MQSSNKPSKLVIPFSNEGGRSSIPLVKSGIGTASLTEGFPLETRTDRDAGGIPPSGLDFNGILYLLSAINRWDQAGAGYIYDGTFANDALVNGYPVGARVLRTDGRGYWLNTTENNVIDPESSGAVAAGWVPDFTSGLSTIPVDSSNVTLTPLQYGKPIILLTGILTANINIIFPIIPNTWTIINGTTGAFTITCKTPSGSGISVINSTVIIGDGTNIIRADEDATVAQARVPVGTVIFFAGNTPPTGFLKCDGAAYSRVTYPDLFGFLVSGAGFSSTTFSVTSANPAVFTAPSHGFTGGERLRLSTSGALYTGLNNTTDYFVEYIDGNTFYLNTSPDVGGSRVATSGSQSGAHSYLQSYFGLGDGSTTFLTPDCRGEALRGWDNGRGVDTGRVLGSTQKGTVTACNHIVGAGDPAVWAPYLAVATPSIAAKSIGMDPTFSASNYQNMALAGANFFSAIGLGGDHRVTAGIMRMRNRSFLVCIKY